MSSVTTERPTFRIQLAEVGGYVKTGVTSKKEALGVVCPTCNADVGEDCDRSEDRQSRKSRPGSLHIDRHLAAIASGARVRYIAGAPVFYDDERRTDERPA